MNLITSTFGKPRVLLPVVHTINPKQVIESISVAMNNGADGVFVINQRMDERDLIHLLPALAKLTPWLGINLLGFGLDQVLRLTADHVQGIWTDNVNDLDMLAIEHIRIDWRGLWFGGVGFKYTRTVDDDPAALVSAATQRGLVDVVTTSGPGTGKAADRSKIQAFRAALDDRPLAIASGITAENVLDYLDSSTDVNAFLVATGIEKSFGVFDPHRVRMLADKIHGVSS